MNIFWWSQYQPGWNGLTISVPKGLNAYKSGHRTLIWAYSDVGLKLE